jgi:hypothetical protein
MGVPPMGCGPSSAAGSSLARRGPAAVSQRLPPSFTAGPAFAACAPRRRLVRHIPSETAS